MDEREFIQRAEQTLREIWVAAKSGGYHFRHDGARWVHTRDGGELFGALSDCASQQSGEAVDPGAGDA